MADSTKLTVRLSDKSMSELNEAAAILGLNRTDTLNRAVQVYSFLVREHQRGKRIFAGSQEMQP